MSYEYKVVAALLVAILSCSCLVCLVESRSYNTGLMFYDVESSQPFLPPTVSVSRGRGLSRVKYSPKGSIWSTFGKPCECHGPVCGCCAGLKVPQYKFDEKMCANVTFTPANEEAILDVYLNEKPSAKYGISARNPSPFCIPVMMGIPMAMCVQMSNIAIQGNNLNMCMDFVVRVATSDMFEMHFQCMRMGLDGVQYVDKNGQPVLPPSNSKLDVSDQDTGAGEESDDEDYYDEVASENEVQGEEQVESEMEVEVETTEDQRETQPQYGQEVQEEHEQVGYNVEKDEEKPEDERPVEDDEEGQKEVEEEELEPQQQQEEEPETESEMSTAMPPPNYNDQEVATTDRNQPLNAAIATISPAATATTTTTAKTKEDTDGDDDDNYAYATIAAAATTTTTTPSPVMAVINNDYTVIDRDNGITNVDNDVTGSSAEHELTAGAYGDATHEGANAITGDGVATFDYENVENVENVENAAAPMAINENHLSMDVATDDADTNINIATETANIGGDDVDADDDDAPQYPQALAEAETPSSSGVDQPNEEEATVASTAPSMSYGQSNSLPVAMTTPPAPAVSSVSDAAYDTAPYAVSAPAAAIDTNTYTDTGADTNTYTETDTGADSDADAYTGAVTPAEENIIRYYRRR